MRLTIPALLLLASLAAAPLAPAHAQQNDSQRQATPVPPDSSTPNAPQSDDGQGSGSSLSDRLSHSQGIVQPPPTSDSGVLQPPPAGPESTPIIRPPGTQGGNEQVQPK